MQTPWFAMTPFSLQNSVPAIPLNIEVYSMFDGMAGTEFCISSHAGAKIAISALKRSSETLSPHVQPASPKRMIKGMSSLKAVA